MIDFKPIEKERIEEYRAYYSADAIGCESNFVNAYLWNEEYMLRAAVLDDTIVKAYFRDELRVWGYCMPRGKNVKAALEAVFADAAERGQAAKIAYMTKDEREELSRAKSITPSATIFPSFTAHTATTRGLSPSTKAILI